MHGPARRAMKQSEIVARQISGQIIADRLAEGTRLPPEQAMIEEYQVGRGTLREALRLLENRGVLSIKTGRDGGPVVRGPRPSDLGEAVSLTLKFDGVPPEEVLAAQRVLASRLVHHAVGRLSPRTLAAMDECLHRMESYVDQETVFEAECARFHDLLAEGAESPVLALLVSAVEAVLAGLRDDDPTAASRASHAERLERATLHRQLHKAVTDGDGDGASAAAVGLVDLMSPATRVTRSRRGVRGATRLRSDGTRPA